MTQMGRPRKHSDAEIIAVINANGTSTINALMSELGLKHKTTFIQRLRRLHEFGCIVLVERNRNEGFLVSSIETLKSR